MSLMGLQHFTLEPGCVAGVTFVSAFNPGVSVQPELYAEKRVEKSDFTFKAKAPSIEGNQYGRRPT